MRLPSSASSATGTGVAPASLTSPGSGPQPGQRDRDLVVGERVQRRAQQFSRAVADHHARGVDVVRRGDRGPQRAVVRVVVDRAPQRERRRVDDLRVRRLMPRRAGQVERRLLRRMAPALLVAALAQLA